MEQKANPTRASKLRERLGVGSPAVKLDDDGPQAASQRQPKIISTGSKTLESLVKEKTFGFSILPGILFSAPLKGTPLSEEDNWASYDVAADDGPPEDETVDDSYKGLEFAGFEIDLAAFRKKATLDRQSMLRNTREESSKMKAMLMLYDFVQYNKKRTCDRDVASAIIIHKSSDDDDGSQLVKQIEMTCTEIIRQSSSSKWIGELELILRSTVNVMSATYETPYVELSYRIKEIVEEEMKTLQHCEIPTPEKLIEMLVRRRGMAILNHTVLRGIEDPLVLLIADSLVYKDRGKHGSQQTSTSSDAASTRGSKKRARPPGSTKKRAVNSEF